jgi:UDP-N-acetylmuramate-alanine ligase
MSSFPRHIHFIGIGGAGMAPLAELMKLRYPQAVML